MRCNARLSAQRSEKVANAMESLTRIVLSRPGQVVTIWALLLVLAAGFALRLPDVIQGSSDAIRDSESGRVTDAIHEAFGPGAAYVFPVIVESQDVGVGDPSFAASVKSIEQALTTTPGVRSVKHYWNAGADELVGRDGKTALLLVRPGVATFYEVEDLTRATRATLSRTALAPGFSAKVTGMPAMFHDLNRNSSADLLHAERIGISLMLIILLIVFGAPVAATLPLILALTSVTLTSAGLYFLSGWMPVSVFVQNAITMIGLGIGVDYALFILSRFRHHQAQGQSAREAAINASAGAGPAAVVSGTAVGIGFLALLLVKASFLHSIALGGLLVVASALAATLTLLPVLLQFFANWLNWPERFFRDRRPMGRWHGAWSRWTSRVMRYPGLHLIAAFAVLAVLVVPVFRMMPWNVGMKDLPPEFEARQGFERLQQNFGAGWMGPVTLLIESAPGGNLWDEKSQHAVLAIASRLGEDSKVARVLGFPQLLQALGEDRSTVRSSAQVPAAYASIASEAISAGGDTALLLVLPKQEPESAEMFQYVKEMRAETWPEATSAGITIRIGGPTAMISDFDAELFGSLWRVVPAVLAVTFVVLLFFFRSVLIPLKAILVNLLSVLAAYGFLVLVFQDGVGASLFGIDPPGGLNSMVVLMLFTILFGLSMDYEIFLLRQIQEEYRRTGDNRAAVTSGLERSAGVITSAAAIMVVLFASFAFTRLTATQEFGLGLAFAVALDATLIRLVAVPALMELFGAANWWCPGSKQQPVSNRQVCPDTKGV